MVIRSSTLLRFASLRAASLVALALSGCVVATYEGPAESVTTATRPTGLSQTASAEESGLPEIIAASHLLVQYRGARAAGQQVTRTKEEARRLAEEALAKARQGKEFPALVAEYSDEPGAADRGGSLGRFSRDQMVPEFSRAAFRLQVGEVSEIVETPFGFHVIQRGE